MKPKDLLALIGAVPSLIALFVLPEWYRPIQSRVNESRSAAAALSVIGVALTIVIMRYASRGKPTIRSSLVVVALLVATPIAVILANWWVSPPYVASPNRDFIAAVTWGVPFGLCSAVLAVLVCWGIERSE